MDQAATLLDLQETDLELMRAEKRLDELPEKLEILQTRHKADEVRQLRDKAEELVGRLGRAVSKSEDECSALSDKIEVEQAKMMSGEITNPKEIQHISREMDALKRRKDKLEVDQMELMERVEKAKAQVDKVDAALAQLAAKEAALTERFKHKGSELIAGIDVLRARRSNLASALDPALLARYETARSAKAGIGAGALRDAMCSACRVELPATEVDALLHGPAIGTCPNCRRLLVIDVTEA